MKRFLRFFLFLLILAGVSLLPGFGANTATKPVCRFVTQAEVTLYHKEHILQQVYTQPSKISAVLNYLRTTEPLGNADSLDSPQQIGYRITLQYSDGTTGVYRQQENRYFSKSGQLWRNIPPEHAGLLYPLIHLLPADAEKDVP